MSLKSSTFLALCVLFATFVHRMMPTGDIRIESHSQATKTDTKCWQDDPKKHVSRLGWINDPHANVKISYNKRTKKCLVQIAFRVVRDGRIMMLSRSVGNTEGREYAYFIWRSEAGSGESPAVFCDVFLSSGEEMECHSEREFDEVVSSLLH